MVFKLFLFVSLLLVIGLTAPLAAEAQLIRNILNVIRINGTVFCTNGTIAVNGTAVTPVFPGAVVQLQCGSGNVVASATTNLSGVFSIIPSPIRVILSSILQNCRLVVTTPLSACNASLFTGGGGLLTSALQRVGDTVSGITTTMNLRPLRFVLVN
ncbi:hypothetical protein ACHQM5_015213 [Ranunculus cassubicifolius]